MSCSEENTTALLLEQEKKAMENCEKDVLCDVEFIQPCGYLLAYDPISEVLTHVSDNISELEKRAPQEYLGETLGQLLSSEICHKCRNISGHSTITSQRESVGQVSFGSRVLDIFAHMKDGRMILEFQPRQESASNTTSVLSTIQWQIERLSKITNKEELLNQTTGFFRAISRFHRVKAYSFLPDGSGEIVCESKEPYVDSFLGLRFPEQDIPKAARTLYATTPIRIISSVGAENIQICRLEHEQPLDLSLALLRGTVPVHMLYLKNMGVEATVTIPIVVDGVLWGLFAFHHMHEAMLDSETLLALEIIGDAVSMHLNILIQKERFDLMSQCTKVVNAFFSPDENVLGFSSDWAGAAPELMKLIRCSGVALVGFEGTDTFGICPSVTSLRALANKLDQNSEVSQPLSVAIVSECISAQYSDLDLGSIVGFLAIPIPFSSFRYLIFCRQSASSAVKWAGNPKKSFSHDGEQIRLHPRGSFNAYVDASAIRSDPFDTCDLIVAESVFDAFERNATTVLQHTANWMELMVRELNHRVRNILALVRSMVTFSSQGHEDVGEFIAVLEQRIQALAEAHNLLTKSDWEPISIQALFMQALTPFLEHGRDRLVLEGPEVTAKASMASLLALVICELASNAVKYGAWSVQNGTVELNWRTLNNTLEIDWREFNGPVVQPPVRQGFGTSILKDALAYEFKATSHIEYRSSGVVVRIRIPLHFHRESVNLPSSKQGNSIVSDVRNSRVLVLEDDFLIASDLEMKLKQLGFDQADICSNIAQALQCIANRQYQFGVLDGNIHGRFSEDVAKMLNTQNIPFIFVTGYGSADTSLFSEFSAPILTKPITLKQLEAAYVLVKGN